MNDPSDYEPAARVVILARLGRAFLTEANIADVADMIARNAPLATFSAGQAEMRRRCAAWHEARAAKRRARIGANWHESTVEDMQALARSDDRDAQSILALPLASDESAAVAAETEEGERHG